MTARHALRRHGLLLAVLVGALIIILRLFQLQVLEEEQWTARAAEQHRQRVELPAERGGVFDRHGVRLAGTHEGYRLSVAPRELEDRDAVVSLLRRDLGLPQGVVARATDPARRWSVLPGIHDASVRERLGGVRGLYFERLLSRTYPHGELGMELLGRVSTEGRGQSGLELSFDQVLGGRPGTAVMRRGGHGELVPGTPQELVAPVPGHDVHLTIDLELQEIAQEALLRAVREHDAAGGEMILADPRTGEILAAASRGGEGLRHWRGATEPYEPGSTMKPFFVAALLAEGRATLKDSVYAEQGRYRLGSRTISDVHPYSWLTLGDALRVSSNIVIAKMVERLEPAQQFSYLRDFGFGTPTGVTYPSESRGVLRLPRNWSASSPVALAIGYEVSATPLQLVQAYGALANGGLLMEPRLVREVRSRDGQTLERHPPQEVRRVVSVEVAAQLTQALTGAVLEGTGRGAALGVFDVAGKTGTSRRTEDGRYERDAYISSFAGFFPAVNPQLVFLVMLDRPQGEYYGGRAAAPVTHATLTAALAARGTALDRGAVALARYDVADAEVAGNGAAEGVRANGAANGVDLASAPALAGGVEPVPDYTGGISVALDAVQRVGSRAGQGEGRPVPSVAGLPLRDAVRRLHGAGFLVELEGAGRIERTEPEAGVVAEAGTIVRVHCTGSQ